MKLSVSIPDALWQQAISAARGDSPSQVVQEALRRAFATPSATNTFSDLFEESVPDTGQTRVERIRDRLLRHAEETWQRGYNDGLDLAELLTWDTLESFGRTANFGLAHWIWVARGPDEDRDTLLAQLAAQNTDGSLYLDHDGDPVLRDLPGAYQEGFERALTDVWRAVAEAQGGETDNSSHAPSGSDDDIPF